jgi:hypothetical protein
MYSGLSGYLRGLRCCFDLLNVPGWYRTVQSLDGVKHFLGLE